MQLFSNTKHNRNMKLLLCSLSLPLTKEKKTYITLCINENHVLVYNSFYRYEMKKLLSEETILQIYDEYNVFKALFVVFKVML